MRRCFILCLLLLWLGAPAASEAVTNSPAPGLRFPIATTSVQESSVSTAFDGSKYLVGVGTSTGVVAQLVAPDGLLIGNRIALGRTGGAPRVAFDGTKFLLVWSDDAAPPFDLYGQFLTTSGTLLNTPFLIRQDANVRNTAGLIFDGTNFLLVWEHNGNSPTNADVYAQFIAPAGTLVGGAIAVSAEPFNERGPSVAFDGANFLVVWHHRLGPEPRFETRARFLTKNGGLGETITISERISPSHNPTAVAFDGVNYLALWSHDNSLGPPQPVAWDLYGRFISARGALVSGEFPLAAEKVDEVLPQALFDGNNFLVTWLNDSGTTNMTGRARYFSRLGYPVGPAFFPNQPDPPRPELYFGLFDGQRVFITINRGGVLTFFNPPALVLNDVFGAFLPASVPSQGPIILTQPRSQTIAAGQNARFSVNAGGTGALTYQWQFNGTPLAGATDPSLTVSNAQPGQAGEYRVVVSNTEGTVQSAAAVLTVLAPPVIATQPVAQSVQPGVTVTFSVDVTGTAPFRFQWQRNGLNMRGETNSTLTIANAQPRDAGTYSVAISNPVGAVNSQAVKLSVSTPRLVLADNFANRITTNSISGTGKADSTGATREAGEPDHANKAGGKSVWLTWVSPGGGTATFTTAGSNFDTLLAVYTGNALTGLTRIASDEDQGGFLTSKVVFRAEEGVAYHIAIDGFAGAAGDVVLDWQFEFGIEDVPQFIVPPRSQTVIAGSNVTFSAIASTRGETFYQWFFKGTAIPGATSSNLFLTNVQLSAAGPYQIQVSTSSRAALSDPAVLEINPAPQAVSQDKFQDLFASDLAGQFQLQHRSRKAGFSSVNAGVLGTQIFDNLGATTELGEPNHGGAIGGASRWFRLRAEADGVMVCDTIGSAIDTVLAVYTGTNLFTLALVVSDNNSAPDGIRSAVRFSAVRGREYLVAVDGVDGAPGNAQLNWGLGTAPIITQQPVGTTVTPGSVFTLSVAAAGTPPPAYQWSFNGFDLPGATSAALTLVDIQSLNAGSYRVRASNFVDLALSQAAQVNVRVESRLQALGGTGGSPFTLRLTGDSNVRYTIEASTNLVNWIPIFTGAANGAFDFSDPSSTSFPWRFYRARQ